MPTDRRVTTLRGVADEHLVERMLDALELLCAAAGDVDDEDAAMLRLAASEIATNVAEHGRPEGGVHLVARLEVLPDRLVATFVDSGDAAHVDLAAARMPDPFAESGRGLALAAAALDELTHDATEAGNTWTLVRRRRSVGGGA